MHPSVYISVTRVTNVKTLVRAMKIYLGILAAFVGTATAIISQPLGGTSPELCAPKGEYDAACIAIGTKRIFYLQKSPTVQGRILFLNAPRVAAKVVIILSFTILMFLSHGVLHHLQCIL